MSERRSSDEVPVRRRSFSLVVAPSVLAADWLHLEEEVRRAEAAGADWLHLDVMDGHFVDNISFGPAFCEAVASVATRPLDVHLMITRPDHYMGRFFGFADTVTVHVEAEHEVGATLRAIRQAGCKAGLALNPPTSFERVEPYLDQIDMLLVMTVNPGFGGQSFMAEVLPKVRAAREWRERMGADFRIEVDGGIDLRTASLCVEAGADTLVAGSSLFKVPDMAVALAALRSVHGLAG